MPLAKSKPLIILYLSGILAETSQIATSLPPANEVCEGYVFTRVCNSVQGGACLGPGPGWRLRRLARGCQGPRPRGEGPGHTQGVGWVYPSRPPSRRLLLRASYWNAFLFAPYLCTCYHPANKICLVQM